MTAGQNELIEYIAELKEVNVIEILRQRLASGEDPYKIFLDCQQGMRLVGERYAEGRYFISGLIMADEILRQVIEIITPVIQNRNCYEQISGSIIIGTVEKDIHDLGKNIVKMLLSCNGFTVHDLGVNVPPNRFAEEAIKIRPDIVGLSGLITAAFDSMKETVTLLDDETAGWNKKPWVIIGGSQVDEQIARLVGTRYWTNDAVAGVQTCMRLVNAANSGQDY